MKHYHLLLSLLLILQRLWLTFSAVTCFDPVIYTSTTPFSCTDSPNNYIPATSISGFPSGTTALSVSVLLYINSVTGTGCATGSVYELFAITINSGGADVMIASVTMTGFNSYQYRVGKLGGGYISAAGSGSVNLFHINQKAYLSQGTGEFITGDWVEIKVALDIGLNQAALASTFQQDVHFDAPLPSGVNFDPSWVFDDTTKFYFGGRGTDPKISIMPSSMTIWKTFLPTSITPSGTKAPGNFLLGHSPVLIKEFLFEEGSGYSLADSHNANSPAYLGASTATSGDTVTSPLWGLNRALNFDTASKYISIPAFAVSQPNPLVIASFTINFWIKLTSTLPVSNSYIFRFYNPSSPTFDKYALQYSYSSTVGLKVGCGNTWVGDANLAPGMTLNTWQQVTVSYALRNQRDGLKGRFYFTVYVDGLIRQTRYTTTVNPPTYTYDPSTDKVIFGGFIGLLSTVQIYNPGSLQAFNPPWCQMSNCAANLGATNPPVCIKPASCDASCGECVDGTAMGCLTCASSGLFYEGKCYSPCPSKTFPNGQKCGDCLTGCEECTTGTACDSCSVGYYMTGVTCSSCPANCDYCSDGSTCTQCTSGFASYQDQCYSTCPTEVPDVVNGECVYAPKPKNPDSPDNPKSWLVDLNENSRTTVQRMMKILNIFYPYSSIPFIYGALSKIIQYTRYMNISRTQNLENLYTQSVATVEIFPMPSLPSRFTDDFHETELPYMFAKYELSSSFMVDFGNDIVSIFVFMALMLVALLMKWLSKWLRNIHKARLVIVRVKVYLQNYVIGQVFEAFMDIVFYSAMECRTLALEEKLASLSFFVCMACLIASVSVFILSFWIIKRYQKHKELLKKSNLSPKEYEVQHEKFNKKYEAIQMLYEDFEDENMKTQAGIMYFGIHNGLFSLIIALLYDIPLLQAALLIMMCCALIGFLLTKKAMKSRLDLAEVIFFQLSLLTIEISLLMRAIVGDDSEGVIEAGSDAVIVLNTVFIFSPYCFMAVKLGLSGWEMYKSWKESKDGKKKKKDKKKEEINVKGRPKIKENLLSTTMIPIFQEQKSLKHDDNGMEGLTRSPRGFRGEGRRMVVNLPEQEDLSVEIHYRMTMRKRKIKRQTKMNDQNQEEYFV